MVIFPAIILSNNALRDIDRCCCRSQYKIGEISRKSRKLVAKYGKIPRLNRSLRALRDYEGLHYIEGKGVSFRQSMSIDSIGN